MKIGVAVAIVNDKNEILIGKRLKRSGFGKYAPPGGKIEPDETVETAAIRETLEETELKLNSVKYIGQTNFTNDELTTDWYICFDFEGRVVNTEPEKCAGWEWHSLDNMPDNLWGGFSQIIEEITRLAKARQVRILRGSVGCGMLEAKVALRNSNWDIGKANEYLRNAPRSLSTKRITDTRYK